MERFEASLGTSQFAHLCCASGGAISLSLMMVAVITLLR